MKSNLAPKGFVGLGLAILIGILALGAIMGAYALHRHYQMQPVTATSTVSATATSAPPAFHPPITLPPILKPTPPPVAGTSASTTVIIQADSGKTIYLHSGDRFMLNLGTSLRWSSVRVDDSSIVSGEADQGSGTFTAENAGTTTLTATGAPICDPAQACPQFIVGFGVTIVVD